MRVRSAAGYLIFFMSALLFFAILLFPGPQAAMRITAAYNQTFDKTRLSADHAKPALPARVAIESGIIKWFEAVETPFSQLTITPSLISLAKQKKDFAFHGQLASGGINGKIKAFSFEDHQFEALDITVSGVAITDLSYHTQQHKMGASFHISGKWLHSPGTDTTTGNSILSAFSLQMPGNSVLAGIGLPAIAFDRVEIDFSMTKDKLTLTRCQARGPALNLELKGDIAMTKQPAFDLEGKLRPTASFMSKISRAVSVKKMFQGSKNRGIPIRITGPVDNPRLRFN